MTHGLKACYDLFIARLEERARADALTNAVAECNTDTERSTLMVGQILTAASDALGDHVLVGRKVVIHGLESESALNDQHGTAVRFVEAKGRYAVQLEGGDKLVRGVNLRPAEGYKVTCPICMEAEVDNPLGPPSNLHPGATEGVGLVASCCGKMTCDKCHTNMMQQAVATTGTTPPCPFCRAPTGGLDPLVSDSINREHLLRRAKQGDAVAMYNLSGSFDRCLNGLPRDYQASAAWAAMAAMRGHVRAIHNLASSLRDGEGVRADFRLAFQWETRAAELDMISSMLNLGTMCLNGHGVGADLASAAKWFKRGKRMGDSKCAFHVARLPPPHGEGTPWSQERQLQEMMEMMQRRAGN